MSEQLFESAKSEFKTSECRDVVLVCDDPNQSGAIASMIIQKDLYIEISKGKADKIVKKSQEEGAGIVISCVSASEAFEFERNFEETRIGMVERGFEAANSYYFALNKVS